MNEELCASGMEMNNSQRALMRLRLCAFEEINCVWLYMHEEQSHGLYEKPTNYHMNLWAFLQSLQGLKLTLQIFES